MQTEKVIDHIVQWLKEYATKANMDGFVVGISGGIDSAVTSKLCAKTGLPTLIELLKRDFDNVSDVCVNLTPVFEEFKNQVPTPKDATFLNLSLANTRARLRMTTLYYFAGLNRFLVAGTGNKVEDFGVGFFTKYGDGGVDLSPIADLLKSEVYKLGNLLNIPLSILQAEPTDGLFGDSRTDCTCMKMANKVMIFRVGKRKFSSSIYVSIRRINTKLNRYQYVKFLEY